MTVPYTELNGSSVVSLGSGDSNQSSLQKKNLLLNIATATQGNKGDYRVLWTPNDNKPPTNMQRFRAFVETRHKTTLKSYADLRKWSIDNVELFWKDVWDFVEIRYLTPPTTILEPGKTMDQIPEWFQGATLNYAENLLRNRDDRPALISTGERLNRVTITHAQLYTSVRNVSLALRRANIQVGDRIAAYLPNSHHAVICMLACATVGAVWCSVSPELGSKGTLDRLSQVQPKMLFCVEFVVENGVTYVQSERLVEIVAGLPSLQQVIIVPCDIVRPENTVTIDKSIALASFLKIVTSTPSIKEDFRFEYLPFSHPVIISFSSGVSGKIRCVVHSAGGMLLQHRKEHCIHGSVSKSDVMLYYASTSKMAWYWQVAALAEGATVILFEGSPLRPDAGVLFKLVEAYRITKLGITAQYLRSIREANISPSSSYNLSSLDAIYSSGSPLQADEFTYIYNSISSTAMVSSIVGSSETCSLFGAHNTDLPVVKGQVQCRALGVAIEVWDEYGNSVVDMPGELVCTKPTPCMPTKLWNDPDGQLYHEYFRQIHGRSVWVFGDEAILDSVVEGLIMIGPSDGSLNQNGLRFGPSELYSIMNDFTEEVADSIAVGYKPQPGLVEASKVVMFIRMRPNQQFSATLASRIKICIRDQLTIAHVPAVIMPVQEIPYTQPGQRAEILVTKILAGEHFSESTPISNPESLDFFFELSLPATANPCISALPIPLDNTLALEISETATTLTNRPDLNGLDFPFVDAGFDSLTILRLKFYLRERKNFLADADHLLKDGTSPVSVAAEAKLAASEKDSVRGRRARKGLPLPIPPSPVGSVPGTTLVGETTTSDVDGVIIAPSTPSGVSKDMETRSAMSPAHLTWKAQSTYDLPDAARRYAGALIPRTCYWIPGLAGYVRQRVNFESNVALLEKVFVKVDGKPAWVEGGRLKAALIRLMELHPALRTSINYKAADTLSPKLARAIMPITKQAELNSPEASFELIKTNADKIRDIDSVHKLVKRTLSRGEKMVVAVWSSNINYVIVGFSQTVCDMETRRLYKSHLVKLYEDGDRKDIIQHKLLDYNLINTTASSRLDKLPKDHEVTQAALGLIQNGAGASRFSIDILVPKSIESDSVMAALTVAILEFVRPAMVNDFATYMGFSSVINVAKEGYSGNGLVDTYQVVNLPDTLTFEKCIAAFKERRTYLVSDNLDTPKRYKNHVFFSFRVHSSPYPETRVRSIRGGDNNGGAKWMPFMGAVVVYIDIWPDEERMTVSVMVRKGLKKGVARTLGGKCQDLLWEHPALRTSINYKAADTLSPKLARAIMPITKQAKLNPPEASFKLIKTNADKIRDIDSVHKLVKRTLSRGEKMVVAVWSSNINYVIVGFSQTVCDMETRRLYKSNLVKLYEDGDRKDIIQHKLQQPHSNNRIITSHKLPKDHEVTQAAHGLIQYGAGASRFSTEILVPRSIESDSVYVMAALNVAILEFVQPTLANYVATYMGFASFIVLKDGHR
ncbi:hypothetical protein SmJEL517_g00795 [Synchytrium microbalum]|uniref:Carrier domain-containing protein n=1 Tax=Synchytrium microbalum TaxID=1806994 RepID=A0A507CCV8_9FUNG|nr:uncharacterized protein SmJEL517_g00795 [Synchytrium microbalum]TPX37178.1 hypothetical protein SmJEL517_g00795 [Synchytrium microbalum]